MCLESDLSPLGVGVGVRGQAQAQAQAPAPNLFAGPSNCFPFGVREGSIFTSAVARRGCNEETHRILPSQHPCSVSFHRIHQQRHPALPSRPPSTSLRHGQQTAQRFAQSCWPRLHIACVDEHQRHFRTPADMPTSPTVTRPLSASRPTKSGSEMQLSNPMEGWPVMHTTPAPHGRQSRSARPRLLLIRLVYCASAAVGS